VLGAVLGAALALGVSLLISQSRRPNAVVRRIEPFVHVSGFQWRPPAAVSTAANGRLADSLSARTTIRIFSVLDYLVSEASVRRRLIQANLANDIERFRLDQLRWAGISGLIVIGFGVLRLLAGKPLPAVPWLIFTLIAVGLGALARDYWLSRQAAARVATMASELPAFAELLAFTVAAGLAPSSALARVSNRVGGELGVELRRCCEEIADGRAFADALEAMSDRLGSDPITRFVDGIVVAVQRGTPIAGVLRAQAMDARGAGHRELMESAGKREIFALVPVVFLILPSVVVVAVFPGVIGLAL
jgi:tight adherence protein C